MKKLILAFVALLMPACCFAQLGYDHHVVFANSLTDKSFYYSRGYVVAPSTLELEDGKLPVETEHFLTPPNALRLKWLSTTQGDWAASLEVQSRYKVGQFKGKILSLWVYSEEGLTLEQSPLIAAGSSHGSGTREIKLLKPYGPLPAKKWVHLHLPFDIFTGPMESTADEKFEPEYLSRISLIQGLDDDKPHTLYIDEITVDDAEQADDSAPVGAPATPTGLAAKGYDRHVDLTWAAVKDPQLQFYKIYRSWDGKKFEPLATQRSERTRYEDFLGASGKAAYYKVAAVNSHYKESALSEETSAATREMTDDELLTMVQEASFRYYWEAAHPNAGMAIEILPGDENMVALGSSGFGIMAIVVGADRGFVTREQAAQRMLKIVRFLSKADRFHGVWPHFLDGRTGKAIPYFGKYDDGGDLVETAFLIQGLLVARQYFDKGNPEEKEIRTTITNLWNTVEWDWYRKGPDSNFLYWHWSPDYKFYIHHPLVGWNETMIVYLEAIASTTHGVPASMYHTGWAGQSDTAVEYRQGWSRTAQGDHYTNGNAYYGHKLDVGEANGAELFFTQFSFMGFDPRGIRDKYTNYFRNNRMIALIAHDYAVENPRKYKGYGDDSWGRSAGVNCAGGRSIARDDNGTINVMASLGAFPYTPQESMRALKHFYRDLGGKLWGNYGFRDSFNETENWFEDVNMALNQAPIVVMIENYRTGLVWRNFMANPEIQPALDKIGFRKDGATD